MSAAWRGSRPRPLYRSIIDGLVFAVFLVLVIAALNFTGLLAPETGLYRAVDGDSLRKTDGTDVRLYGIDAPELHQTCHDAQGQTYACGRDARNALAELIAGRDLKCFARDTDRYGRSVQQCSAGPLDINAEMVREGWAIAYRRHALDYVAVEATARKARAGIWQGSFEDPEQWRNANRVLTRGDMGDSSSD